MRDPERIDPFLAEVGRLWKKYPDFRFMQMIINIKFERDPWNMEEDEFLKVLREVETPFGKLGD